MSDVVRRGQHGPSVDARAKAGVEPAFTPTPRSRAPWSVDAYRRAREAGAEAVLVRIDEVIERDQGVCYLCGQAVPRSEISIDHIIPLSMGGSHTLANLGLTHLRCNVRKGSTFTDKRPLKLAR